MQTMRAVLLPSAAIACLISPIVPRSAHNHVFFALLPCPGCGQWNKGKRGLVAESARVGNTVLLNSVRELGMSHKTLANKIISSVDTVMYGIRYML